LTAWQWLCPWFEVIALLKGKREFFLSWHLLTKCNRIIVLVAELTMSSFNNAIAFHVDRHPFLYASLTKNGWQQRMVGNKERLATSSCWQ
jgi:hypothetical protein